MTTRLTHPSRLRANVASAKISIVLHNIGRAPSRLSELRLLLDKRIINLQPIHLYLINEPVDPDDKLRLFHDAYSATPVNIDPPVGPQYTNKHLATVSLFMDEIPHASIDIPSFAMQHCGITWSELRLHNSISILVCNTYFPNPASPEVKMYTAGLVAVLMSNIDELMTRCQHFIIGVDGNCPIQEKGILPLETEHYNARFIRQIVKTYGAVILNFDVKCKGFATRQSNLLDLFIASKQVEAMVYSMTVHTGLTVGSDHCWWN